MGALPGLGSSRLALPVCLQRQPGRAAVLCWVFLHFNIGEAVLFSWPGVATTFRGVLLWLLKSIRHMHQEFRHVREPINERPLLLPLRRETPHPLFEPFGHVEIAVRPDREA